jgi:non-ribosomal peptide synthetase component F
VPDGVTQEMLDRFKDLVFEKSVNIQVRRGDPVRERDWAAIEAQRELQGLTDQQIAEELGLTERQVTFIRIVAEREHYRLESHGLLYELHGNRAEHVDTYQVREARRFHMSSPLPAMEPASYLRGQTLGDVVRAGVASQPDQLALIDRGRGLRFRAFLEQSQALAGGLRELGIGRGDVVAAQLPGCAEFFLLHLAVSELGAVLNPIPMTYRAREVEYVLQDAHAKAIVLPGAPRYEEAVELVDRLRPSLTNLAHVVLVGGEERAGTIPLSTLLNTSTETALAPMLSASDPFVLLYTSGTEGPAKGVIHPHDTLLSNAFWLVDVLGITRADTVLSASPIAHLFALYLFYLGLHTGSRTVILEQYEPGSLAALVERERVTVLGLAPAQLLALLQVPDLAERDLSALRLVITSGAPCPAAAYREAVERLGCTVVNQWGMTELQAGTLTRPGDPLERTLTTAGQPAPGVEICSQTIRGRPSRMGPRGISGTGARICSGATTRSQRQRATPSLPAGGSGLGTSQCRRWTGRSGWWGAARS